MKLTRDSVHALFNCGAPNSAQLHLLGLPGYPLRSGWMEPLMGREIPNWLYQRILDLKGRKPKGALRKNWRAAEVVFDPSVKQS